jgi:bleomycin hydrolase
MKSLDHKILSQLESKLDHSEKRRAISDSIQSIGISKTALAEGKKSEAVAYFEFNSDDKFRDMEGNDLLNECINEIEKIAQEKGQNIKISKAYLMFWERLERANLILETLIENNFKYSQLEVNALIESWMNKFGNWNSYFTLVQKYGILPLEEMESNSITKNTAGLDRLILIKLKQCSALLYRMKSRNFDIEFIQAKKNKALSDIYNMLTYSLGNVEKKEEALEYSKQYLDSSLKEFTNVLNFPSIDIDFNMAYCSQLSKISVDEAATPFLNLEFDLIEKLLVDQIFSGNSVIISSENFPKDIEYFYDEMFDYNETMATCLDLDKGKRLNYGLSELTSISRVVAFNLENEKPINWKITFNSRMITVDNVWLKENAYKFIIRNEILEKNGINIKNYEIIELDDKNPLGVLL